MKTRWESLSVFIRIHNLFHGNNQGFKVDGSGANRLVQLHVDPGCPVGRVDVGKDGQCAWRTTTVRLVRNEKMWRPIRLCLLRFGYRQAHVVDSKHIFKNASGAEKRILREAGRQAEK